MRTLHPVITLILTSSIFSFGTTMMPPFFGTHCTGLTHFLSAIGLDHNCFYYIAFHHLLHRWVNLCQYSTLESPISLKVNFLSANTRRNAHYVSHSPPYIFEMPSHNLKEQLYQPIKQTRCNDHR